MTPDIDEIERRAKAATPGEWTDRQDRTVAAEGVPIIRCYAWRNTADNAAHIAGMSPAVTLGLVARIRRAEEALTLARSICADAFKDTGMDWDAETMAIIDAALNPTDPTP